MTMMKKTSITKKSVLIECIEIFREQLRITSRNYRYLEPAKGMEQAWQEARWKLEILEDLCQSMDSPLVEEALTVWRMEQEKAEKTKGKLKDWQKVVMEKGPEALPLDQETINENRNPINGPLPDIRELWGWK